MSNAGEGRVSDGEALGVGGDELSRLLDEAVARLVARRQTFTDEEALRAIWDAGYDLGPQEDPRFALARDTDGRTPRQWRLAARALANDRLLDRLASGEWNGYGLDAELARLDELDQTHYVFCPIDPRFRVRLDGGYESADREPTVTIPPATKAALGALEPALLQRWNDDGGAPWTTRHVVEILGELGWADARTNDAWRFVGAWLKALSLVARVGLDFWVPADAVPVASQRSRLQVLPVLGSKPPDLSQPQELAQLSSNFPPSTSASVPWATSRNTSRANEPDENEKVGHGVLSLGSIEAPQVTWTVPLRTIHLVEGFVPVPLAARHIYPRRRAGEGDRSVLPGTWFETSDKLWVWLDRGQDRLYGPGLAEQLAWLEAGDRLRIDWGSDEIVFRLVGHDEEVQREETRLVDLEALAEVRSERGESYLRSLQAILEIAPNGLTFPEIVRAICDRQGHEVHRGTVRALLPAGGFTRRDGRWFAAPDVGRAWRSAETAADRIAGVSGASVGISTTSVTSTSAPRDPRTAVRQIRARLAEVVAQLRANRESRE